MWPNNDSNHATLFNIFQVMKCTVCTRHAYSKLEQAMTPQRNITQQTQFCTQLVIIHIVRQPIFLTPFVNL